MMIKPLYILFIVSLTSTIYANGIHCGVDTASPLPIMKCRNLSEGKPVLINYRKMPGWNTHASLLLIEICEYKSHVYHEKKKIQFIDSESDYDRSDFQSCIYRFCTNDSKNFKLWIHDVGTNGGTIGVKFWVGREKNTFEFQCEEVGVRHEGDLNSGIDYNESISNIS